MLSATEAISAVLLQVTRKITMYRFGNIDVSNAEPFDSDQSLDFPDGLTMIGRGTASGKETVIEMLRREFQGAANGASVAEIRVPTWLVFLDIQTLCHCQGGASGAVAALISSSQALLARRHEFEGHVTRNVMTMLGSSYGRLRANVSREGGLQITDERSGRNIDAYFHSMSKQIILFLAINKALRILFPLDLPLVIDSLLDNLDMVLLSPCFQFICSMNGQRIVIATDDVMEKLDTTPDYRIAEHPASGKSIIQMYRWN